MGRLSRQKQVLGSIPINPNDCVPGMMIDPLTIEYRANMTEAPKYTLDSQPSWLPLGWTMERAMDITVDDWKNLTEDQQDSLRAGFEAHCGSEFKGEVFKDMSDRSRIDSEDFNPPITAPNFMRDLQRYHSTDDWGFVFYRTTYEQDDEEWSNIQKRLNAIIESVFDFYSTIEGVNEARLRWKLHWMDDRNEFRDMNPHSIAAHYRNIVEKLPSNYQHSMCFAVDQISARSILLTDITRMQTRPLLGDVVPFVIAIDQYLGWSDPDAEAAEDAEDEDEDEDGENWCGPFRAHPSSIIDEIYTIVASQLMETHEFAYAARGTDDVWWSSYGEVWTVDGEGRYAERHFEDAALLRAQYREKKRGSE